MGKSRYPKYFHYNLLSSIEAEEEKERLKNIAKELNKLINSVTFDFEKEGFKSVIDLQYSQYSNNLNKAIVVAKYFLEAKNYLQAIEGNDKAIEILELFADLQELETMMNQYNNNSSKALEISIFNLIEPYYYTIKLFVRKCKPLFYEEEENELDKLNKEIMEKIHGKSL